MIFKEKTRNISMEIFCHFDFYSVIHSFHYYVITHSTVVCIGVSTPPQEHYPSLFLLSPPS